LIVGAYTDPETGLLYLINRYYDPATAQFLSVDPAVDVTQQPYAYVGDNPLNQTDPSGLGTPPPGSHAWCTPGKVAVNGVPACGDGGPHLTRGISYGHICFSFVVGEACIDITKNGGVIGSSGPGLGYPGPSAGLGRFRA
jgi:RHS repeat-associated protein